MPLFDLCRQIRWSFAYHRHCWELLSDHRYRSMSLTLENCNGYSDCQTNKILIGACGLLSIIWLFNCCWLLTYLRRVCCILIAGCVWLRRQLAEERTEHNDCLYFIPIHICRHSRSVIQGSLLLLYWWLEEFPRRLQVSCFAALSRNYCITIRMKKKLKLNMHKHVACMFTNFLMSE